MMYGLSTLFAQKERREIGLRTRKGLEEAIKQSKYPNKAPYGYYLDDKKYLHIDPVTSIIVKDIYDMYLKGLSSVAIMDKLKKDNRYTDYFSVRPHTIIGIIRNPIYKGDLNWGHTTRKKEDTIYIENHHEPIISKELWDKAQTQIEKNTNGGYGEKTHIFHYLVKCPYCNKTMSNYFGRKKLRVE